MNNNLSTSHILGWALIILAAFCETYAALVVKLRFNVMGDIDFHSLHLFGRYMYHFFRSPLLLSGVVAFFVSPVAWFVALSRIDLSIGYPVLVALHLLFVALFGISILGETFNYNKFLGFLFVMLSLYFFRKGEGD